jgi:hypothetical protein
MTAPTYLGEAHASATSVSFTLPYGTELLVIFGGYSGTGSAAFPSDATFNSVACGRVVSADSSAGTFETACAIFIMLRNKLPAPGSAYTASHSGGAGTSPYITVAAFGGITNETYAIDTDTNVGSWDLSLDGILDDLMVGMLVVDDVATPTLSGGTIIYAQDHWATAYYIFTASAAGHVFNWSVAGTENPRDTSCAATFHAWGPRGIIWM